MLVHILPPLVIGQRRNEMIGNLSKENKEIYLKDAEPLQKYIDAKDEFDYKNNNYTTTEFIDTTPDEKGYTDKFGEPLKEDGIYGAKTRYAQDNYDADNGNSPATDYELVTQKYRSSGGLTSRSGDRWSGNTAIPKVTDYQLDYAMYDAEKDAPRMLTDEELAQKYDYEKAYQILTDRNALVSNENEALNAYGITQEDVTTEKVGNEDLRGVWVYFNYKNGYITNIRKVED